MKLESEHVLGVQIPSRKSYNPFDSDDEIEAANGYLKSSLNGYDIKSFETNDDSLTFHLDSGDLSWEEAILGHSQILSRRNPAESGDEEVLFRKDTELFTDKTVTDSDLPEMMVYYKDNSFHSVKDIGIDEGMPAHDKVSIKSRDKSDNHGSKNISSFLGLNGHSNGDEHLELPYIEGLKSRADNDFDKDVPSQKRPQDSLKASVLDSEGLMTRKNADEIELDDATTADGFKNDSSKEQSTSSREIERPGVVVESGSVVSGTSNLQISKADELNDPNLEKKKNQASQEEHDQDKPSKGTTRESSPIPSIATRDKASVDATEDRNEEASTSQSAEHPASQDSSDNGGGNVLSYNSTVESGSIILDFNSSTDEGKEEKEGDGKDEEETSQQTKTVAKLPEAQSMSRHDEGPSGSIFNSGSENRVHGETSFSAAIPSPASITYMGPHAHTGCISLRSESSHGSTRSFAFPVLQAEWNSSPVRMAKAEQRNFRKQRGWIHSIMCCRF